MQTVRVISSTLHFLQRPDLLKDCFLLKKPHLNDGCKFVSASGLRGS